MGDYAWIIIVISIYVLGAIILRICEAFSDSKKYLQLKPKLDNLEKSIKEHEFKVEEDRKNWILRVNQWNQKIEKEKEEINKIAAQKSMGFPWLAEAFAEYFALKDGKFEAYLNTKKHPAHTTSEIIREVKNEKKLLKKENKILSYKINYFEKLFPWLTELIAENEDEEIPVRIDDDIIEDDGEDRVKDFLTPEEYKQLSSVERNQKALDRYLKNRNKSKWAIGRDYEMYVGYLYEQKGYAIEYKGIIDGYDDLGRDIIAKKTNEICVIQCKYWAHYKEIHEKHIFQLFGTTMEYWIQNFKNCNKSKTFEDFSRFLNENKLRPIFFTSISLSDRAKEMAQALSVEVIENEPIGAFPRIKCNISRINEEKIYHLPFDQQYDRTIIEKERGEFCAFTVKEAEDAGFRRAFKHRFKSVI
jgi:hypothetical protein